MNRLSRRLMLLPLLVLVLGVQSPGVQAVGVDIDRFDILFTGNNNNILKWNPANNQASVVFQTGAAQPGGLVALSDGAGGLNVLMGDAAQNHGVLCCQSATGTCQTIPGSQTSGGVGGIAGTGDGQVLFVNDGGSSNVLGRIVKDSTSAVCGLRANVLDPNVPGGSLLSVRASTGAFLNTNQGDVLLLSGNQIVRWNGQGSVAALVTDFAGQTPRDFVESPEGGLLVATAQNTILRYGAGKTSPGDPNDPLAGSIPLSGSGKRLSIGHAENTVPQLAGKIGALRVCASLSSGSNVVQCFDVDEQVVVAVSSSGNTPADGIVAGAGSNGAAVVNVADGQATVPVLATTVTLEGTSGGSAVCEVYRFPDPRGSSTNGPFTLGQVPGLPTVGNTAPPGGIPMDTVVPARFVPLGSEFVLWSCESTIEVTGLVGTSVIEDKFGLDEDTDADTPDGDYHCHADDVARRPRVCKSRLTGEPGDAESPNCYEITGNCNSPAFLWSNRPFSLHILGGNDEDPSVTATERADALGLVLNELTCTPRGTQRSLDRELRSLSRDLGRGRFCQAKQSAAKIEQIADGISDSCDEGSNIVARARVIQFHLSQPETCP